MFLIGIGVVALLMWGVDTEHLIRQKLTKGRKHGDGKDTDQRGMGRPLQKKEGRVEAAAGDHASIQEGEMAAIMGKKWFW